MTEMDEDDGLDARRMPLILHALAAKDSVGLAAQLARLHPADIADLLEQITPSGRRAFLALALAVRALATRDLTSANAARVVRREVLVGVLNGLALALLLGMAGWLLYGEVWLGVVLGLAMITNQVVAALGGVMVPLTLERAGLDPALASGTFVTTLRM